MMENLFKQFVGMFLVLFGVEILTVQRMKEKESTVEDRDL